MSYKFVFFQAKSISKLFRPSNFFITLGTNQQRTMSEQHLIKDIKFVDLKEKVLNGNITFIDVREPNELKDDGKIPNSVNIPLGQIGDAFQLSESIFQSKYGVPKPGELDGFVISCRSGKRATNAFNKIAPMGYKNAMVYIGSFQDWLKNGGPVEK